MLSCQALLGGGTPAMQASKGEGKEKNTPTLLLTLSLPFMACHFTACMLGGEVRFFLF